MKMVKFLLLGSLFVLLSGCNTARGIGADLEVLGRKMQGLNNDDVMIAGVPPESNVVEVPTTYQSGQSYQSYDSYQADTYQADTYSTAPADYNNSAQVYTTPYEGDTTYTTLPDAITYPVEN